MVRGPRRSIYHDQSALTAVVATAMLIGVVVLLGVAVSAMIFILVGDQPEQAPTIGFIESESDDQWILSTAPEEIAWTEYEMLVTGNTGTIKVRLNAEAGTAGLVLKASPTALPGTAFPGVLAGGQFLDFCSSVDERNARISLVHTTSDAVAHRFTFQFMPANVDCTP